MRVGAPLRKAGLTLHVVTSVGWLGAVLAFLVLAVTGLTLPSPSLTVRAAYVAMNALARGAILPLCVLSLVTGIVQSWGTKWGLMQHYWVVFKLVLNLLCTVVLVGHMGPIAELADVAIRHPLSGEEMQSMRLQVTLDAAAALVVLLVATALAVFKPRGLTSYGSRQQKASRAQSPT